MPLPGLPASVCLRRAFTAVGCNEVGGPGLEAWSVGARGVWTRPAPRRVDLAVECASRVRCACVARERHGSAVPPTAAARVFASCSPLPCPCPASSAWRAMAAPRMRRVWVTRGRRRGAGPMDSRKRLMQTRAFIRGVGSPPPLPRCAGGGVATLGAEGWCRGTQTATPGEITSNFSVLIFELHIYCYVNFG